MSPAKPTYDHGAPILRPVVKTIDQHAMFAPGDKVLVGVSGGPDSMALLHLLNTLAPAYKIELAVAHMNHGLRPQVDHQETEFVEQVANELRLTFHLENGRLDPGQSSLEERARDIRHTFYASLTKTHGYTKIALGHQADDDAESVLLHLLRGSGLRGLSGIAPVRDRIVRPLIDVHRIAILEYLERLDIHFLEDASNADLRFDRNRIRHELLPLLQEHYNPNIIASLHRMAGICRDEDRWLDRHLEPLQKRFNAASTPQRLTINLDKFSDQPCAVQRRLIRSALRQWRGHLQSISARHVEALIRLSSSKGTQGRLNLPGGLAVERHGNELNFIFLEDPRRFPDLATPPFCHSIDGVHGLPAQIDIPEAEANMTFTLSAPPTKDVYQGLGNHTTWFDLDKLAFPIYIRNVAAGDRFKPLGAQGTQKVKKLFIDRKIHKAQRSRIPILASNNTIYWVAGLRRSRAALISKSTTQALCVICQQPAAITAASFK